MKLFKWLIKILLGVVVFFVIANAIFLFIGYHELTTPIVCDYPTPRFKTPAEKLPAGTKVARIQLPGIFNQATKFYGKENRYALNQGYMVYPVDLPYRNTPFSQPPPPQLKKIRMDDDFKYVLEEIKKIIQKLPPGTKVVLEGHSRGGLLAMLVAQEIKFDAIILLAPSQPKGLGTKGLTSKRMFGFWPTWLTLGYWKTQPVKRWYYGTRYAGLSDDMPEKDARKIQNNLVWEAGGVIADIGYNPPEVNPKKIKCPDIIIIGGTQDDLVSIEENVRVAYFLKTDIEFFKNAHYIFWGPEGDKVIIFIDYWIRKKLNL